MSESPLFVIAKEKRLSEPLGSFYTGQWKQTSIHLGLGYIDYNRTFYIIVKRTKGNSNNLKGLRQKKEIDMHTVPK